jgi:ankyrin repeat protein
MDQFDAARVGDLQQLRAALTLENVNDAVGADGWTALLYASLNGHVECAKLCIEMGANVNARCHSRSTALHFTSSFGNRDVARALLSKGAIVDATMNDGQTPLFCAFLHNCVDTAYLLIDRGATASYAILNAQLPIPDWATTFIESRSRCRSAANIIIGIHKYRRTNVTGNNDINVLRLISKHIWSTRMDDVWSQSQ